MYTFPRLLTITFPFCVLKVVNNNVCLVTHHYLSVYLEKQEIKQMLTPQIRFVFSNEKYIRFKKTISFGEHTGRQAALRVRHEVLMLSAESK